ncbi:methyltransferase domain-containing protein [Aphanizomenon sp. PH219]|nr:methyltransferase domain-containing protein [Aphanizomenon sp. 202]MDK2459806.1 methyltransferase domain-containing protein [Aphanizomenon sp. PH219]
MHNNSILLFKKYALSYFKPNIHVLEIGPDGFPSTYQSTVNDSSITWETLDIYESSKLTYTALSEYIFPIQDQTYDIIISGQVIEHIRKPWVWIKEVARLCKPEGLVITINPVSWPYHEAPIDCWRAYPEGMKALYEDAKLDVIMSTWESLESPQYSRYIPGQSRESQKGFVRDLYQILGKLGFPFERAYDTITIGKNISLNND